MVLKILVFKCMQVNFIEIYFLANLSLSDYHYIAIR